MCWAFTRTASALYSSRVVLKSGEQLLKHLKDSPAPDLILLDVRMPEMDGFETLTALRKTEKPGQETPVIFLTASEEDDIYMMGLLHDVGKIGIPDEVINKPGRLTDEEFALIKKHPSIGAKILENIEEMPELVSGAKWHHERFDGRGYPEGLSGKDIPEQARIIAVADAYDAMTSNRSYRGALPQEKVREQIESGKGTQFDPQFADIMLAMIDEDTDYKMQDKSCH